MKKWETFREFISYANKHCDWLILRNFEYLPDDFFGNDKDVDILCLDLEHFVSTMGLVKRSWGVGAYKGIIQEKEVDFDIRFLGDGYYDKLWQSRMLKNKQFTVSDVPRMSIEDYFYSLIWHAKLQKTLVKDIYVTRLHELAREINLNDYQPENIYNDQYIATLLSDFCLKHYYRYETPFDSEIPLNMNVYIHLDDRVTGLAYKHKKNLISRLVNFIPNWLLKPIPKATKNKLKNLIGL
ncbi:hypothetical protein NM432_12215 [Vibrio metschnikovii]